MTYEQAIQSIADDIEKIERDFPQLKDFSTREHCDPERLSISYGYHTHQPQRVGGWSSAVPNPDDDGVWFYIDFHDPDSMAQIHTQPGVTERRYRDKRVMFLILEGESSKSLFGALEEILKNRGISTHGF